MNRTARCLIAAIAAPALVAGAVVGLTPPASATTNATSAGSSRFLSGSLLLNGVNLDSVLALGGVAAASQTGHVIQTSTSPLDLTALNALTVDVPGGVHLPLSQFLNVGAVNQYAQANPDGTARAASGAVANSGAVDTSPSATFPADANLDLASILGTQATGVLDAAKLAIGGITAVAATDALQGAPATSCTDVSAPQNCRDYTIARGTINLTSPLVGTLITTVGSLLDTVSAAVDATISSDLINALLGAVTSSLSALNTLVPGLSLLSNNLAVSINSDLRTALNSVLTQTLSDGLVSIDLTTGDITVDLDALLGGLNNLPPNTELLTSAVITDLVNRIGALLTGLTQDIVTTASTVLDAVNVTISGGICLLEVVVCTAGLDVAYSGTLSDLVGGASALTITGTGLLAILDPILLTLLSLAQATLGIATGTILSSAATSVSGGLAPAVTTLTSALDPVLTALPSVLSLVANVQEPGAAAGSYREAALRASVGSGAVVSIDLARAEVSAQAVTVAPSSSAAQSSSAAATTTATTSAPVTPTTGATSAPNSDPAVPMTNAPGRPGIDTGLGANAPASSSIAWRWTALGALLLVLAALLAGTTRRVTARQYVPTHRR